MLSNLKYTLNLSSNKLTGDLPSTLVGLANLQQLDVSHNNLSGSLATLGKMPSLVEVDVSYNLFSGPIPPALMNLFNKSSSSFLGNSALCVDCSHVTYSDCTARRYIKPCDGLGRKSALDSIHIALITLGSSLFSVLLAIAIFYICVRSRGRQNEDVELSNQEGTSFLFNKLMEATENLNEKYIIGRGAHGTVYKASLGSEKIYAVKKLDFGGKTGANESMIREVQTLGKIRHRNLVKLEGFWLRKGYGLILYQYMENGSLRDVLQLTDPLLLPWAVRYKIAIGMAQGLAYLHFDCHPAIIHRDIKPENVLLDSNMEPHISDFGIAKLLNQSPTPIQSLAVPGTTGYIAPENAFATMGSIESDVYSYGVVMLELLTRKKAVDASFPEGMDLVGWVRSALNCPEQVDHVIDETLREELLDSEVMEQVFDILSMALRCTEREPFKRPSMRDVVKQLEDINPTARGKK